MIHPATLDNCLRRLDTMAGETYRRDFRVTAQLARRIIRDLTASAASDDRRLDFIAKRISESAAVRPQMVYRLRSTGEYRWMRADAASAKRIPARQWVGTYDAGNDWRLILEDLQS